MTEDNTYSKIKQDFYYRYSKYAVPELEGYDKNRKITFIIALLIIVIIVTILGLLFIRPILESPETDNKYVGTAVILFFIYLISSFVYGLIKKGFEIKIKKRIMPAICACFPDLKWKEPDLSSNLIGRISEYFGFFVNFSRDEEATKYKLSNLIPDFTRVEFDDCYLS